MKRKWTTPWRLIGNPNTEWCFMRTWRDADGLHIRFLLSDGRAFNVRTITY